MSKIFHHTAPLAHAAWPGGYPITYVVRSIDGRREQTEVMCPKCATFAMHERELPWGGRVVSVDAEIHWEGAPMECESGQADDCAGEIESAYGDPDAEANADA